MLWAFSDANGINRKSMKNSTYWEHQFQHRTKKPHKIEKTLDVVQNGAQNSEIMMLSSKYDTCRNSKILRIWLAAHEVMVVHFGNFCSFAGVLYDMLGAQNSTWISDLYDNTTFFGSFGGGILAKTLRILLKCGDLGAQNTRRNVLKLDIQAPLQ